MFPSLSHSAVAQRIDVRAAQSPECRDRSKDQRGCTQYENSEGEHLALNCDAAGWKNPKRGSGSEQPDQSSCDCDSGNAGHHEQDQGFDRELLQQSERAAPQSHTDSKFSRAMRVSAVNKASGIDARDQQQDRDCREQEEQRTPDCPGVVLLQTCNQNADAGWIAFEFLIKFLLHPAQVGLCLSRG